MVLSDESVFILRKLYGWNRVGNKYINIHDVIRIFPRRLRSKKVFRYCIKELRKGELIIMHKKGECISLNKHKLGDIEAIIG